MVLIRPSWDGQQNLVVKAVVVIITAGESEKLDSFERLAA